MSLSPKYWGPPIWTTMYTIAYTLPTEPTIDHQQKVSSFYTTLADLLPCEECREHYHSFLDQNPVDNFTDSRDDLLVWVNNLHNLVNKKTGAPQVSLT